MFTEFGLAFLMVATSILIMHKSKFFFYNCKKQLQINCSLNLIVFFIHLISFYMENVADFSFFFVNLLQLNIYFVKVTLIADNKPDNIGVNF